MNLTTATHTVEILLDDEPQQAPARFYDSEVENLRNAEWTGS